MELVPEVGDDQVYGEHREEHGQRRREGDRDRHHHERDRKTRRQVEVSPWCGGFGRCVFGQGEPETNSSASGTKRSEKYWEGNGKNFTFSATRKIPS